jgi:transcriptional regulator with XRE-family HTH domain
MEQGTVNERLNYLVKYFEFGKKAAFARKAGISPQGAQELLAGRKGDPSFKVLVRILEAYPQVYADWLVLGRGPMLQSEGDNEHLTRIADNANVKDELTELQSEIIAIESSIVEGESMLQEVSKEVLRLTAHQADITDRKIANKEMPDDSKLHQFINQAWGELTKQTEAIRLILKVNNQKLAVKQAQYISIVNQVLGVSNSSNSGRVEPTIN